jgi:hypothetical protein
MMLDLLLSGCECGTPEPGVRAFCGTGAKPSSLLKIGRPASEKGLAHRRAVESKLGTIPGHQIDPRAPSMTLSNVSRALANIALRSLKVAPRRMQRLAKLHAQCLGDYGERNLFMFRPGPSSVWNVFNDWNLLLSAMYCIQDVR